MFMYWDLLMAPGEQLYEDGAVAIAMSAFNPHALCMIIIPTLFRAQ